MSEPISLLWPSPRRAIGGGEELRLAGGLGWRGPADLDLGAARDRVAGALSRCGSHLDGTTAAGSAAVTLRVDDTAAPPQGYRLAVSSRGVEIVGADPAGLHHATCTLAQWLLLHAEAAGGLLPALEVTDWPSLARRGVLLDVSRDKVPTLTTLLALADRLAGWKVNQLQLYTEHTFAYRGHEEVWADASPITPDDVRTLDAHCRRLGIELVPNQNSFGHFHRWLVHPRYRKLAELPEGLIHPFGDRVEPFSLCPVNPNVLVLLADLFDQLLPLFTSREFNVGLDETLDLGKGCSAAACAAKGRVRVYLEFLQQVHALVAARGHRMQFWGDIILEEPELIAELPADAIALEWGYEADHPFTAHAQRFAASGLDFMVCPGTSSWNSFAGRADNAVRNLASAALAGADTAARGCLVTDWGDFGHLQPLPVSYLGFLAGAGFSWNAEAAADPCAHAWPALLDAHAFLDDGDGLGLAAWTLAEAYRATGALLRNGTVLFYLLVFPHQDLTHRRYRDLGAAGLDAAEAEVARAQDLLRTSAPRGDGLARRELSWVAGLLRLACRLGRSRLAAGADVPVSQLPPGVRRDLAAELAPLIAEHGALWAARNRTGGRASSVARLQRLERLLAGEAEEQPP